MVLVCQIGGNKKITDGEWLGYFKHDSVTYPFVLRDGDRFDYGYEDDTFEPTNIGGREISEGEYFTVTSYPNTKDESEGIYQITSVHRYEG
ncbi:hypothetical protein D3C78_1581860 [compost metagenome]